MAACGETGDSDHLAMFHTAFELGFTFRYEVDIAVQRAILFLMSLMCTECIPLHFLQEDFGTELKELREWLIGNFFVTKIPCSDL